MTVRWDEILLAFLHDPPDKALSIRGHIPRARDNARIAVGDHVSRSALEDAVSAADPLASIIERLPVPTAGEQGERAVEVRGAQLHIVHPLSAASMILPVPELNEELTQNEQDQLRATIADLPGEEEKQARNRLFAVWRLWPDALSINNACFARLPADTRTPDHTIWNHLDVTAAFKAAEAVGQGTALLAFALGPVQRFIEASRSVRDLWSGSMILSWLAFRAMLPVIEQIGPTALVHPALRGNPLLDLWLRADHRLGGKAPLPEVHRRLTPSLPHRFLALVPWGVDGSAAKALAAECEQAVTTAWKEMADAVRRRLKRLLDASFPGWDKRWDGQIASDFGASTAIVPLAGSGEEVDGRLARLLASKTSFAEAFPDAEAVRRMARAIPPNDKPTYSQDHAGRWQYQVELVGRSLAAERSIRHVPTTSPRGDLNEHYPQKCTLLGSFEQMGPDDLAESNKFWDEAAGSLNGLSIDGVRIRKGEALCAVAMVKRFAGPAFFVQQLGIAPSDLRFSDTWTLAAAEWLSRAEINPDDMRTTHGDWNGQWLNWRTEQEDQDEPTCPTEVLNAIKAARDQLSQPPVYYAMLKLDGDDVGGWLRGEKSPKVREVMHPRLVDYYEGLGDTAKPGLDACRPVGPALHAAISTALANFALHAVPDIVRRHYGTTIYSGGDDTLVLLPVSTALACALELRRAYMSDWWRPNGQCSQQGSQREFLMMGSRATLSGGLVVVHAKDDLRLALQDTRHAEKQAKERGKDALVITVRRRSGEHTSALCPWDFVPVIEDWRKRFKEGASDRWVYHLYGERPTLGDLPPEAVRAELRRQIGRADAPTPSLIPPEVRLHPFATTAAFWQETGGRRRTQPAQRPANGASLQTAEMLPPEKLVAAFDCLRESSVRTDGDPTRRFPSTQDTLDSFLTLCHTASFLARGRD